MSFPSHEQREYLNSSIEENWYLEACPGSGKTEVIAAKVIREIDSWDGYPGGLAVLSFANSAVDELKSRIGSHLHGLPVAYPHWISTIDSFIFSCIVAPVAHQVTGYAGDGDDYRLRLVDSSSTMFIRTKYALERVNLSANKYDYDLATGRYIFRTGETGLDRKLNALKLADWQIRDLSETKTRFKRAGFATYRDIEQLAIQILERADLANFCALISLRYPLLLVDECQDLSAEQLEVLGRLIALGTNVHMVGDLNQSIYGFRHADPARVRSFISDQHFGIARLSKNFRSSQAIVDLCSALVPGEAVVGNAGIFSTLPIVVEYESCPSQSLPAFMDLSEAFSNRVVVSRGYSTLHRFCSGATELNDTERLALACAVAEGESAFAIHKSLELLAGWLVSKLEYTAKPNSLQCPLNVESALEWRLFLHQGLMFLRKSGASVEGQNWKGWCKLATSIIGQLPRQPFVAEDIAVAISALALQKLRSPSGRGEEQVSERLALVSLQGITIRLATIHEIKGETHEATMLVSASRRGDQSHWADWIGDKNSEAARLAYVASSRPKNLLVWAVKKLKPVERDQLQQIGFTIASGR